MVKDMCREVGIEIRTNHSLRATGVTSMFRGNVPENIIQNVTGHRSLEALRKYEHISTEQHQVVSKVMTSTKPVDYETEIKVASSSECSTTVTTAEDQVRSIFGNVSNCSIGSITLNLSRKWFPWWLVLKLINNYFSCDILLHCLIKFNWNYNHFLNLISCIFTGEYRGFCVYLLVNIQETLCVYNIYCGRCLWRVWLL